MAIYPVDRVIQPSKNWGQINHYPADSVVSYVYAYPLDSDLTGCRILSVQTSNNWGQLNHYPADSVVCYVYTLYPLDSDLAGCRIRTTGT